MKPKAAAKGLRPALAAAVIAAALLMVGAFCSPPRKSGASWEIHGGEPVIRLHVRASGDSPGEQRFKMVLVEQIQGLLSAEPVFQSGDYDASLQFLQRSLPALGRELQGLADESAGGAPVAVHLSRESFPLRTYGRRIFPAGEYTALIVTVGGGTGENWWCLLFPALCLPPAAGVAETGPAEPPPGSTEAAIPSDRGGETSEPFRWRCRIWEAMERSAIGSLIEKMKRIFYN